MVINDKKLNYKHVMELIKNNYITDKCKLSFDDQEYNLKIISQISWAIIANNLKISEYSEDIINAVKVQFNSLFNFDCSDKCEILCDEIINPSEFDILGRLYEEQIHFNGTRKSTGQFYSPQQVVDYMVDSLEFEKDNQLIDKKIIDISCGTGVFLISGAKKAISILKKNNVPNQSIIKYITDHIYGLDINPISCKISEINLYVLLINEFGPKIIIESEYIKFHIYETNSIENRSLVANIANNESFNIKNRLGDYKDGFDYILGNPPYLEAKKMHKNLKEICKSNFPITIFGAFDLYIAFMSQCNKLVSEQGEVCLILPNKFTVAKYGTKIRDNLLKDFSLIELVDLSEMDLFHKASVYPIVIRYKKELPKQNSQIITKMSIKNFEELASADKSALVPQNLYKSIGYLFTYFCLPSQGNFTNMFLNIFDDAKPIEDYLDFKSTVSFHKKGLREQFVKKHFVDETNGDLLRKYLGGKSYSRKNEVGLFEINWDNYYINYDQMKLKEIGNLLPPISNFEREKIIFCQHARQITATYDQNGEFVTKDVYPIAFAKSNLSESVFSLKYFLGLLNSKLFSFIYGVVYKGIQISAGYYHYLPTWMSILPIVNASEKNICIIEELVNEALNCKSISQKTNLLNKINDVVYDIYNVNQEQQLIIKNILND